MRVQLTRLDQLAAAVVRPRGRKSRVWAVTGRTFCALGAPGRARPLAIVGPGSVSREIANGLALAGEVVDALMSALGHFPAAVDAEGLYELDSAWLHAVAFSADASIPAPACVGLPSSAAAAREVWLREARQLLADRHRNISERRRLLGPLLECHPSASQ